MCSAAPLRARCEAARGRREDLLLTLLSGWRPYITESLMSPDRVGVMFWGSHRQVCSPSRWAEPSVLSGGCTVIKNDSVSRTCERFAHRKPSVVKTAAASRFPLKSKHKKWIPAFFQTLIAQKVRVKSESKNKSLLISVCLRLYWMFIIFHLILIINVSGCKGAKQSWWSCCCLQPFVLSGPAGPMVSNPFCHQGAPKLDIFEYYK